MSLSSQHLPRDGGISKRSRASACGRTGESPLAARNPKDFEVIRTAEAFVLAGA